MRIPSPLALAALATAVLVPAFASAQPAGMPMRKAGLWQMTMDMNGMVPLHQTMQMCTDPATEKPGAAFSNGMDRRGNCTSGPVSPEAGGWRFSSTCTAGKMTIATTGVARGDFGSGYHMESVTKMDPPPMPQMAETHMTIDAKWLGPCPAGMKPGAMSMVRK